MEKKNKIALIVCAVLIIVGFLATAYNVVTSFIIGNAADLIFTLDVDFIMYLFLGYYVVINYKKPHGNTIRVLMLVFAATVALNLCGPIYYADGVEAMFSCIICGLVCYMAGRLNKEKQSVVIAVIAWLLLLHIAHAQVMSLEFLIGERVDFVVRLSIYSKAIMWMAICASYFTRFKEHKQAGLE